MSDYHLVSTLHAARVRLVDARKAAAAAVAAADAEVAAARAAVDAALADGRVASDKHLLDLDLDSLGAIASHLGPRDAFFTSQTCTTLRSALFRGGLPGPLAGVCQKSWQFRNTAATKEAALRALDGMRPALGAQRLDFVFCVFDMGHARVLARALDAAPHAARIDIKVSLRGDEDINEDRARLLADVLSSPDRTFAAPPQVHLYKCDPRCASALLRLTRAGVCVTSIEQSYPFDFSLGDAEDVSFIRRVAVNAANTLTQLSPVASFSGFNLTTRFPALRRLILDIRLPGQFTTDTPSLTTMAPLLKEIEFKHIYDPLLGTHKHGFGFEPPRFARFVAAIHGVTRVSFGSQLDATLSQNENLNLGQLAALQTLRELEMSTKQTFVTIEENDLRVEDSYESDSSMSPFTDPVAEDAVTNLPPLAPGLTRLAFSGSMRVAFGHPLPELQVLDWRGSCADVLCGTFILGQPSHYDLDVPLAIPSAAIAPNLHTLLIGYDDESSYRGSYPRGKFDLWTLVAARTALRVVVIERTRLRFTVPDSFGILETATTDAYAELLERNAEYLTTIHMHGCEIERSHELAVENFLLAFKDYGYVCRAGVKECLFCMLHDGTDLWPRR